MGNSKFRAVSAITLVSLTIVAAAESQSLKFEVASIKPSGTTPGGFRGGGCRGADNPNFMANGPIVVPLGRCRFIGATLKSLASTAYGLDVEGGSGWMDSEYFDIQAEAANPSTATRAELHQMLQQLLADRFMLKARHETKEVGGYELVVAKTGLKMNDATGTGPRGVATRPGNVTGQAGISVLAAVISRAVAAPVLDHTGLEGTYQIRLQWAPDPVGTNVTNLPSDPTGPSIFTALQEQLGLRLQATKVMVEVLVIDSGQKPSEN